MIRFIMIRQDIMSQFKDKKLLRKRHIILCERFLTTERISQILFNLLSICAIGIHIF